MTEPRSIIAIDADPAAGLAYALGVPDDLAAQITPIAALEDLIYERTGARPGAMGGFFKLNPRVDDIPDRFSLLHRGVRLLQLGSISQGGGGCICPESAVLKALVAHLILYRDEVMILDMEAGIEHQPAPEFTPHRFFAGQCKRRRSRYARSGYLRRRARIGQRSGSDSRCV